MLIVNHPPQEVPLSLLLSALPELDGKAFPETAITGITLDSRQVKPGNLFVALTGGRVDGHQFIRAAIENGAAVIVGTQPQPGLAVPYMRVANSRKALAVLSAGFYGFPARQLTVIGVTGTDGKTTTSTLIFNILKAAGLKAGMVSTVNATIGDQTLDTGFHVTTPEAPDIQRFLSQMVTKGLTHVVLEATSHGLEQQRVFACDFDLGVVTNITHEHLDYHGSHEAYRAAKARLFSSLSQTPPKSQGNPRLAVLNRDDSSYEYLSSLIHSSNSSPTPNLYSPVVLNHPISTLSYGMHAEANLRAEDITFTLSGMRFEAVGAGFRMPIDSSLSGEFNIANCLAAVAATVMGLGVDREAARVGIRSLQGIPGRMERIEMGQDFLAIVDFAHTPNALQRALHAARRMTTGRVIAVFGSAGLRDRLKRRMMAETSIRLADITILTAEDPRTESLDDILSEMAQGALARGGIEGKNFFRIPDRGEAIRHAIAHTRPGDLVIALGKGHEQSMCFGEVEVPWDDRTAVRAAIAERMGIKGPKMPGLPTSENFNT
jgi:UDP-N-acetylmuramoyl-L-alanyl-D-glutamate--2,6-diaminopimelate ligase